MRGLWLACLVFSIWFFAEMITLFHVSGAYVYVDPDGNAVGVEDVFTKLAAARAHYEAVGLGADYADRFVR